MSQTKTLPDQIADLLIALMFTEDLNAGDKLPPERQLADMLGVDRTSLRMALRTLIRMNAASSVQGSGIRINDYHRDCGLDFLDNLYRIPELELGGIFLSEGLSIFKRAVPMAIRLAVEQAREHPNPERRQSIINQMSYLYQALHNGESAVTLAMLEVDLTDAIAAASGNPFMRAAFNSSKRIRTLLTQKLYEFIDIKAHFDFYITTLNHLQNNQNHDDIVNTYFKYIDELTQPLEQHLHTLPPKPALTLSPLHNDRNIIELSSLIKR